MSWTAWELRCPQHVAGISRRLGGPLQAGEPLWTRFHLHVHAGRDRNRLVKRSMVLVVFHEVERLCLGRAEEAEQHLDPLEG